MIALKCTVVEPASAWDRDRQTDGQTDRRTDVRIAALPPTESEISTSTVDV